MSVPPITIPSIVVSSHKVLEAQSSSSLEVADIFDRYVSAGSGDSMSEDEPVPGGGSRRGSSERGTPKEPILSVEPAMFKVNAVSLDAEDAPSGERRPSLSMLLPPSPSNSTLTSPTLISPVTVIELDHLDNQDSMDSGDSACLTVGENPLLVMTPEPSDLLQPIEEEEAHSSDQSHCTSFEDCCYLSDTAFSRYSSSKNSFDEQTASLKDLGISADDGTLSPIAVFPTNVTFTSRLDADTLKEVMNSRSDSFHSAQDSTSSVERTQLSIGESCEILSTRVMRDVCVQGDDGTLSPIMFNPTLYNADYQITENVFFASDKGTQCNSDLHQDGNICSHVEKISTASQTIFKWHGKREGSLSYQSHMSTDDNFEPMCDYLNKSSQTDVSGDSNNNPENISPDTMMVRFQNIPNFQMFCNHCQKSFEIGASITSMDNRVNMETPDNLDASWKSGDSADSVIRQKRLDTIIERLSKKTNLIRERSRTKSASLQSRGHVGMFNAIENNNGEVNYDVSEEDFKHLENTSKNDKRRTLCSEFKLNGQRSFPRSPTLAMRTMSENSENSGNEDMALCLAEDNVVVNSKCGFIDSRNNSAGGSVTAPTSRTFSRNLSLDSRRTSTGEGTHRGSLVRQHRIELSTALLNMKDFDNKDLESGSDREKDVYIASRSRNYGDELGRNRRVSPPSSQSNPTHAEAVINVATNRHPVQYKPYIQQKSTCSRDDNDTHASDLDRMPSRVQKDGSSRVRVQRKSKLKTKHTHPHLLSRRSSSLNTSVERDQLASSIATDLFQSIGIQPGLSRRQILDEIAMDYLVMKAVNRTLDQLYSMSGEMIESAPQNVSSCEVSGTSAARRSSYRMTSVDSSDASSEVSHRGRDGFLKSAPQVKEPFSWVSTCDNGEDEEASAFTSQFTRDYVSTEGYHRGTGQTAPGRGAGGVREDYTVGSDAFRISLDKRSREFNQQTDSNTSKRSSSVSSQDGETRCCILLIMLFLWI